MDKEKAYKTIAKHVYIITNLNEINTINKILILADNEMEANRKARKICKTYSIKPLENEKTEDVQVYKI